MLDKLYFISYNEDNKNKEATNKEKLQKTEDGPMGY